MDSKEEHQIPAIESHGSQEKEQKRPSLFPLKSADKRQGFSSDINTLFDPHAVIPENKSNK